MVPRNYLVKIKNLGTQHLHPEEAKRVRDLPVAKGSPISCSIT
jgi:hypothetical protein